MDAKSIDIEALKNDSEFQKSLALMEQECKTTQSIAKGYQLLDTYLAIEKDEESIHELFRFIVDRAFENFSTYLTEGKTICLEDEEAKATARAVYEFAMQRYSEDDTQGAVELFALLSILLEDETLSKAMLVHACSAKEGVSFERFVDEYVDSSAIDPSDPTALFATRFVKPLEELINIYDGCIDDLMRSLSRLQNPKD